MTSFRKFLKIKRKKNIEDHFKHFIIKDKGHTLLAAKLSQFKHISII
jgi:hypothetical protein